MTPDETRSNSPDGRYRAMREPLGRRRVTFFFVARYEDADQGLTAPWYMGLAYVRPARLESVFCVIPFNWIVRFFWITARWIRFPKPTKSETESARAYSRGWRNGILWLERRLLNAIEKDR